MTKEDKFLVFIADDDESYLKLFEHFLNSTFEDKIKVISFETCEACLEALHMNPNIIFLDYYFINEESDALNGLETLKLIKEQYPATPVIMLSVQERFGPIAETILEGASDYLIKDNDAFESAELTIKETMKQAGF